MCLYHFVDALDIQSSFSSTEDLEAERLRIAEQMNADADAVQALIAENARRAQDQEEYEIRFEKLSDKARESRALYDKVTADITMREIRRREFGRFIQTVEGLSGLITEFDEALWSNLVDHITVYNRENIVFTMTSGMEIKA